MVEHVVEIQEREERKNGRTKSRWWRTEKPGVGVLVVSCISNEIN